MIRALWYIVKVGVLVAAAVWLADRPGKIDIEWLDYKIHTQMGLFLLASLFVILLAIFIYRVITTIAGLPRAFRRYKEITDKEKGHRALALGLTAVAAGDTKAASQQANRAVRLLPNDKGMPLLLMAQAERLKGNEEEARRIFGEMLENKDTAFLGVRGLLQGALEAKNYLKALELAQRGLKLYPRQKWVLRTVYDLEIRTRNWAEARKILTRAEKSGAVTADQARSDRVAMLMAEGDDLLNSGLRGAAMQKFRAAHKMDPYFVPAVLVMARMMKQDGQRRAAAKLVEKTWTKIDHPELAKLWIDLADTLKTNDPLTRLKWMEKLIKLRPESPEANLAMAQAAMEASLWGEARGHIERAELITQDSRIYKLRAEVEKRSVHDDAEAVFWLEKADEAPEPRTWVCCETGRIYPEWSPIAEPHGAFNTIVWDFPDVRSDVLPLRIAGGDALLEAPRV
jgi:HemY protein